jgi:hypothetical protein
LVSIDKNERTSIWIWACQPMNRERRVARNRVDITRSGEAAVREKERFVTSVRRTIPGALQGGNRRNGAASSSGVVEYDKRHIQSRVVGNNVVVKLDCVRSMRSAVRSARNNAVAPIVA